MARTHSRTRRLIGVLSWALLLPSTFAGDSMACLMDEGVAASIGAEAHGPSHEAHSAGHHERHEDASPSDDSHEGDLAPCPLAATCGSALVASPEPDDRGRPAAPEQVTPAHPRSELRSVSIAPEPPPPRTV